MTGQDDDAGIGGLVRPRVDPAPGWEVRLDEVVALGAALVHLERLDGSSWWLGVTLPDGRRLSVHLGARRAQVRGRAEEDG